MILTYKVKHNRDFAEELIKAKQVAEYAIANRKTLSTKYIRHIGLKAVIANQILRKYGKNAKAKQIHNVNLIIPNQGIRYQNNKISITCLKLEMPFNRQVKKINQIELDNVYAYISCEIEEQSKIIPQVSLGIDFNTTGHCAVVACPENGKVWKLGKRVQHVHKRYNAIRKSLQKQNKYKKVKQIKNKESRIVRDHNHKISRFIVNLAKELKGGVKLENLKGIRENKKCRKKFRYALNSWSFYQLRRFIEYKTKLAGIPVTLIAPQYTSQTCSRCGHLGERTGKQFKCPTCGHVENADVNAAFNIAKMSASMQSIFRLAQDRDCDKGNTDIPKEATLESKTTLKPCLLSMSES